MNFREKKIKWLAAQIDEIKQLEEHTQSEIAKNIGLKPSKLSRIKAGDLNLTQDIIDALVKRYNIIPPNFKEELHMSEPNLNYETTDVTAERLKIENEHLRQRLKEAEQHIRTLEEFNQYLKKRNT